MTEVVKEKAKETVSMFTKAKQWLKKKFNGKDPEASNNIIGCCVSGWYIGIGTYLTLMTGSGLIFVMFALPAIILYVKLMVSLMSGIYVPQNFNMEGAMNECISNTN